MHDEGQRGGYAPPVDRLLTLGDPRDIPGQPKGPGKLDDWPDYLRYGLGPEQAPELLRMATDRKLNRGDPEGRAVWGPLHAWRALGQLRAEAAIGPLLGLLADNEEDDWLREELPEVFALIGPAAIPALVAYLADDAHELYTRVTAAHALERIGATHPEARDACVAAITHQLERYADNDPELNGFLISYLIDFKATEAAPLMQRAFAAGAVDLLIAGDWDDVRVELGLLPVRVQLTQLPPGTNPNRLARAMGLPDLPPESLLRGLLGDAPRSQGSGQKAGTSHKSRKGGKKRR